MPDPEPRGRLEGRVAPLPQGDRPTTRAQLSRGRVVAAALALVDRAGLEGLTMRALGRELGVDPMAAYHHVPGKAAILQGVVEAILAEIPRPEPQVRASWREALGFVAREYRRALLAHPNALPIVSTQPVMTPAGLALIESAAAALVRGGLTPAQAIEAINGTAVAVIGSALAEGGVTPGMEPVATEDVSGAIGEMSTADFPTLAAALASAGPATLDHERRFEDLLETLVRGFEARFGRGTKRRPGA